MSRALLVIGSSHVAAFSAAARLRREADPDAPRTRVIRLGEARYAPYLVGTGAAQRFGPALVAEIEAQIARHQPRVVAAIGGNAHTTLALIRHARPFDFRLSGEASPPIDPDAELVVESLLAATLAAKLAPLFLRMRLLAALIGPVDQLESPPPVRDDAYIAAQADTYFRERGIAVSGVAGAGLRYRMWRLASRLIRAETEALGAHFLPVPRAALDADGFLRRELAHDATHGNAAYGDIWIEALGG